MLVLAGAKALAFSPDEHSKQTQFQLAFAATAAVDAPAAAVGPAAGSACATNSAVQLPPGDTAQLWAL